MSAPLLPKPRLDHGLHQPDKHGAIGWAWLSTCYARPVSAIVRSRVNLALTLNQHQPTHGYEQKRVLKDGEPEWLLVKSTRRGAQWSGPRSCLRIWSRR
jgi:hypothetical protein